jgi:protocatechuate 3,4-dioxygenase, beta subunit
MSKFGADTDRRWFLGGTFGLALSAMFWDVKGAFAAELARTPALTEGPFYPPKLPLDTDNDLILLSDKVTPAVGEITHLSGRVLSVAGEPIKDATVEIWQCDAKQHYIAQGKGGDANFQGFGRFTTGTKGEYRFRTIKPVAYPGRTPHIHFKVKKGERTLLTSQIFIAGHPQNARDGVYREAGGVFQRELVMADFRPMKGSKIGEWTAVFDIVVGLTPASR